MRSMAARYSASVLIRRVRAAMWSGPPPRRPVDAGPSPGCGKDAGAARPRLARPEPSRKEMSAPTGAAAPSGSAPRLVPETLGAVAGRAAEPRAEVRLGGETAG